MNLNQVPLWVWIAAGCLGLIFLTLLFRRSNPGTEKSTDSIPLFGTKNQVTDHLSGGLQQMPLPDLLQFLASGRQSGVLWLNTGRRQGRIRMVQGMVTEAEYRRSLDLDALFQMLSIDIGDFRFQLEKPRDGLVRGREVVDIIMLWMQRKEAP